MLRDTSMANTRSRSVCSAARAIGICSASKVASAGTYRKIHIMFVLPDYRRMPAARRPQGSILAKKLAQVRKVRSLGGGSGDAQWMDAAHPHFREMRPPELSQTASCL